MATYLGRPEFGISGWRKAIEEKRIDLCLQHGKRCHRIAKNEPKHDPPFVQTNDMLSRHQWRPMMTKRCGDLGIRRPDRLRHGQISRRKGVFFQ